FQGGDVTNMIVHSKHLWEFEYPATDLQVAGIEFQPSEEKYQHIIEAASQSLACRSLQELKQILRIGIHLNDYKTWFSLNKKGEHCHLISMEDCLIANEDFTPRYKFHRLSRIDGETRTSTVYLAKRIHYSLFMAELYQVTSNRGLVDLEIDFENPGTNIRVEGILFQPLEKVGRVIGQNGLGQNGTSFSGWMGGLVNC
nr:protein kinase-like domain, phloem protein 2-like protein [Tanacetum cinerariifolium]